MKGGYFKGDLYIDAAKNNYKALEFKRYNVLTVVTGLAAKETRNSISKSNLKKITGNYKGDGMQNGGLIIVAAGGEKVLFSFKQKSPGDHVENDVILNTLGITSQPVEPVADGDNAESKEEKKEEGKETTEAEGGKDEGTTASEAEGEKSQAEGDKGESQEEGCGASGGGGC